MSSEGHTVVDSNAFVLMMCVRRFWLIFFFMFLVMLLNEHRAQ